MHSCVPQQHKREWSSVTGCAQNCIAYCASNLGQWQGYVHDRRVSAGRMNSRRMVPGAGLPVSQFNLTRARQYISIHCIAHVQSSPLQSQGCYSSVCCYPAAPQAHACTHGMPSHRQLGMLSYLIAAIQYQHHQNNMSNTDSSCCSWSLCCSWSSCCCWCC